MRWPFRTILAADDGGEHAWAGGLAVSGASSLGLDATAQRALPARACRIVSFAGKQSCAADSSGSRLS